MIKIIMMILMFFLSACSVKEYKLFQQEEQIPMPQVQEINISYSSKIVPNDIIKIDIYNMNQKSNIMMQDLKYQDIRNTDDNTYIVYEDGTIILPLLNSVKIEGLTIKALNERLTMMYKKYLKAPYIKASIKNHKVFVLGEVVKRGVVAIEGENISVIEALAKSGGLTDYAVRNRIRIISENKGKYQLTTLNLNKFKTLNNNNLMLKHNSIIYVEPKSTKAIRVGINDYLPIVQAVSSMLSTFLTIEILKNQ